MSKGFDYVQLAALVATLEEDNAEFEKAAAIHKETKAVCDERGKKVAQTQAQIDAVINRLRQSEVPNTPWSKYDKTATEIGIEMQARWGRSQMQQFLQASPPPNMAVLGSGQGIAVSPSYAQCTNAAGAVPTPYPSSSYADMT